ncbi:MAG: hypothetical protein AB1295_01935 [Candidatus Micrarchaeota archaeon]
MKARLDKSLAARQSPSENLHVFHSKGELVVYPFFFSEYKSLVKDLERIAGGIENKEIVKL